MLSTYALSSKILQLRSANRKLVRTFSQTLNPWMIFEGNTTGIQTTEEERMTSVFGGRLKGESPKSTSRIIVSANKKIAGIDVPDKPEEPDNCCMSGCVNCVWEIYNDDIRHWRKLRKQAAISINKSTEIWPEDWKPPLALLDIKNVPKSLIKEKIKIDNQVSHIKTRTDVRSLFPKRDSPLPENVVKAKMKNELSKEMEKEIEEDKEDAMDNEGWDDIPVYIKAFAEFERKKRLLRRDKKLRIRKALLEAQ